MILVGTLIGAIGIGGVLLVPLLTLVTGMGVHVAIASAMFSYLFTGIVGAAEYARRGTIQWRTGLWLCLGGMPGAYVGALTTWMLPSSVLEVVIGSLVFASGIKAMRPASAEGLTPRDVHPGLLLVIGVVTGFGSAITGTGGPLVLVPILLALKVAPLTAVGLSQIIQIPIAILATWGNVSFGHVDFKVGLMLSVLLVLGVIIGAKIAHQVSKQALTKVIAVALLGAGAAMLAKVAGLIG